MSRLQSVKDKLSNEWLEAKNIRTQNFQQYIGKVFDNDIEKALQKYCIPYTCVEISKNREEFEHSRQLSSTHALDNRDAWVLCLLNESNVILDIDYAMG